MTRRGRLAAPLAALVAVTVAGGAAPGHAQGLALPVRVEREGLTVRGEAGLERLAADVAARAPAILAAIDDDLAGLPRPLRIEIRLVKSADAIAAASPIGARPPAWADGVAYSRQGVVVIATRRGATSIPVRSVVAHELAHLALDAALGDRAPRWLAEGFAYLHSSDWSFARLRTLTGMAWTGRTIPLDLLDQSFPARQDAAARAYAESYDFVVFLARRGRYPDHHDDGNRWAFRAFLAAIAAGQDVHGAAREAYSASLDELFEEWYQNLRQRYLLLPIGLVALGIWVIAAVLLILGYLRRRRQNRRKLARWEAEEASRSSSDPAASGRMEETDPSPGPRR
jgi:hypothetical protein